MAYWKLNRRMMKMVELSDKFWDKMLPDPDADTIRDINASPLTKRIRRLVMKKPREIMTNSFVIPVDGGAVTGYYYCDPSLITTGQVPLIVYYHGGGWTFGNMDFFECYLSHLSHVTGAAILSIDYRLSPTFKFPIPVEDCYDALVWAYEGAKYWKIDPDKIYVAGESAGGNLAAAVAMLTRDRKGPQLAGQILIYPITDGRLRTLSFEEYKETPMLSEKVLRFYIENYAREPKDILSPMFSPLLAADKSRLAPALIITADHDPLKDDGLLYAAELEEAGTEAKAFTAPESFHGFMTYRYATGREESECAIRQFVQGRSVKSVEFEKECCLKKKTHIMSL